MLTPCNAPLADLDLFVSVFMHWLESGRVTFFDHLVNTMPDQQGQVIAGRGTGLGLILGQVSVTYIVRLSAIENKWRVR